MNNLQRLQLEVQDVELTQEEMQMFLAENGLNHFDEYLPASNASKKSIYKSAYAILSSIANNPSSMKNYKQDDMTIMDFATSIQNRLDQLDKKIRSMTEAQTDSSFFNLFK